MLNENSDGEELQEKAEWIQWNFVNHLNRHCKKTKVCGISKRWWTAEIEESRKILGFIKRFRKRGEAKQQQVKKEWSNLRWMIWLSKTKLWSDFLGSATSQQV